MAKSPTKGKVSKPERSMPPDILKGDVNTYKTIYKSRKNGVNELVRGISIEKVGVIVHMSAFLKDHDSGQYVLSETSQFIPNARLVPDGDVYKITHGLY